MRATCPAKFKSQHSFKSNILKTLVAYFVYTKKHGFVRSKGKQERNPKMRFRKELSVVALLCESGTLGFNQALGLHNALKWHF